MTIVTPTDLAARESDDGLWIENLTDITPPNLYEAQLRLRLGDDQVPDVGLVPVRTTEDAGIVNVVARLSEAASEPVELRVHTRPDSASPGQDFYGFSRVLTIPRGRREVSTPLRILNDDVHELEERLFVRIATAEGARVPDPIAPVTIVDDDPVGPITASIAPGESSGSIPVTILDDTEVEASEVFFQRIVSADGAVIGRREAATLIIDDD